MGVSLTIGMLAGQLSVVARPTSGSLSRLVVHSHGAGETWNVISDVAQQATWPEIFEIIYYLAERNYAVVAPALFDTSLASNGQTWGNNASTTQLASVITAAQALPGVSAGKYGLIGSSMGNVTAANHVRRAGQTNIAGMLGLIPVSDLGTMRGTDAAHGLYYTEVNAAHGITTDAQYATVDATYDPRSFASTITIPWALWYHSDDTIVPAADVTALAAAAGNGSAVNLGTGGHAYAGMTGAAVYAWLDTLTW